MMRLLWIAPLLLVIGCPSAYAPTVTARNAQITGVTNGGLQMLVDLVAYNPNAFDVSVDSLTANLVLNGSDLGTVELNQVWTLPAQQESPLQGQFVIPYSDLPSLLVSAVLGGQVPYTVSGEASVDGYPITVDYEYSGSVDRGFLLNTATGSLGIPFLGPKP